MDNRQYRKLSSYDTVENPESQDLIPTIHTEEGGRKVNRNIPVSTFKDYTDTEVSTLDSSLATVAKTGSYNDLTNRPTVPSIAGLATEAQVQDVQDNLDTHEADTANPHSVTKAQVGLGNVDNTSDADKPVSTATQNALNAKVTSPNQANKVLITASTGANTVADASISATPDSFPRRTSGGQVRGNEAQVAGDLVNKGQMDAADALKVNKAGDTMTGVLRNTVSDLGNRYSRAGAGDISAGIDSDGTYTIYSNDQSIPWLKVASTGMILGPLTAPRIRTGTGFPNGVVSAPVGSTYIDTAATNGAIEWKKATGTGNTGWVVSVGDTGWRNVTSIFTNLEAVHASDFGVMWRRVGDTAQIIARAQIKSLSTAVISLPAAMYGQSNGGGPTPFRFNGQGALLEIIDMIISVENIYPVPSPEATIGRRGYINSTYRLSNYQAATWPTTLPGTPA